MKQTDSINNEITDSINEMKQTDSINRNKHETDRFN